MRFEIQVLIMYTVHGKSIFQYLNRSICFYFYIFSVFLNENVLKWHIRCEVSLFTITRSRTNSRTIYTIYKHTMYYEDRNLKVPLKKLKRKTFCHFFSRNTMRSNKFIKKRINISNTGFTQEMYPRYKFLIHFAF